MTTNRGRALPGARRLAFVFVIFATLATAAAGCDSPDLNALKARALGIADKYRPQVQSGLTTVQSILAKAKTLPAETPGLSELTARLGPVTATLDKLKAALDALPAQADAAVQAGDGAALKALATGTEETVGAGLKSTDGVLAEAQTKVEALHQDASIATARKRAAAAPEALGPPLAATTAKVEDALAKARALPTDKPGVAELVKSLEAKQVQVAHAKTLLDGLVASVEELLAKKDPANAEKRLKDTQLEIGDITKKVEVDLIGLLKTLAQLSGEAPAAFDKTLASGFEVKGNGDGVEAGLIAFIEDGARPVDKTTWFDFDRLTFASGGTALDMTKSVDQLTNIVEILKAYPSVKLKVGGYTDSDGAAADNKRLSQRRADAVVKALVDLGVAADRLEAEGYGPEFPVCPANDTPECKAKNRRTSVRVAAK